jgi:hypothetical protein
VYNLDTEDLRVIVKTFQEVFPSVFLFEPLGQGDLFVVGSPHENYALNFDTLEKKFDQTKVRDELARIFSASPQELIAYLAATDEELGVFTQGAKIHTDNHPILEYSTPKTIYKDTVGANRREVALLREKMAANFSDVTPEGEASLTPAVRGITFPIVGGDFEELQRYFTFRDLLNPFHFAIQRNDFDIAEGLCRKMVKLDVPILHPAIKPLFIERCYE